jgi:hypothetical protein
MFFPVLVVLLSDLGHERVGRIGVGQHRRDAQQHLDDTQRWAPLALEDVEADQALAIDVAMVNLGLESDLRGEMRVSAAQLGEVASYANGRDRTRRERCQARSLPVVA